jgi:hypothetical protein
MISNNVSRNRTSGLMNGFISDSALLRIVRYPPLAMKIYFFGRIYTNSPELRYYRVTYNNYDTSVYTLNIIIKTRA